MPTRLLRRLPTRETRSPSPCRYRYRERKVHHCTCPTIMAVGGVGLEFTPSMQSPRLAPANCHAVLPQSALSGSPLNAPMPSAVASWLAWVHFGVFRPVRKRPFSTAPSVRRVGLRHASRWVHRGHLAGSTASNPPSLPAGYLCCRQGLQS